MLITLRAYWVKRAVSRMAHSFCLSMPVTRHICYDTWQITFEWQNHCFILSNKYAL